MTKGVWSMWTLLLLCGSACGTQDPEDGGGHSLTQGGSGDQPSADNGTGSTAGTTAAQPDPATGGTTAQATAGNGTGGASGGGAGIGSAGGGGAASAEACRGFSFDGLIYSPGGSVLPNICEPFHPTTNNPYAVRCVDAWPWYKTQFPGDEFCILPPPPDKGVQYGVHPQGKQWFAKVSTGDMSGYAGLSTTWTMEAGEEEEGNYVTSAENAQPGNFYRSYVRMRPGSHHMIVSSTDLSEAAEVWGPGSPDGLFGGTRLPSSQRPDENAPKSLDKPVEDAGLYQVLPAKPGVTFNMHHFNATSGDILKEAWTNLWWESEATTRIYDTLGVDLLQVATLAVEPGTTQDLHYSWEITEPIRMLSAFGHRHAWTTNFSTWIEKPGGATEILYQSFDWFDEPTYRYDSMTQNPTPAPQMRSDGASSGVRMLNPGEKLHFNCHIEFTEARAVAANSPKMPTEIGTLRFANQAFTAEMCILFGSTAKVELANPVLDETPLPDFATID